MTVVLWVLFILFCLFAILVAWLHITDSASSIKVSCLNCYWYQPVEYSPRGYKEHYISVAESCKKYNIRLKDHEPCEKFWTGRMEWPPCY